MQPSQAELGCFWAYVGIIIAGDREYDVPDTPDTYDCCLRSANSKLPRTVSHFSLATRVVLFGTAYSSVPVPLARIPLFQVDICCFSPTFLPVARYRNGCWGWQHHDIEPVLQQIRNETPRLPDQLLLLPVADFARRRTREVFWIAAVTCINSETPQLVSRYPCVRLASTRHCRSGVRCYWYFKIVPSPENRNDTTKAYNVRGPVDDIDTTRMYKLVVHHSFRCDLSLRSANAVTVKISFTSSFTSESLRPVVSLESQWQQSRHLRTLFCHPLPQHWLYPPLNLVAIHTVSPPFRPVTDPLSHRLLSTQSADLTPQVVSVYCALDQCRI